MISKRLALGVATVALGVASAASSFKVTLDAPLSIGSTELKAGEYKVEMQGYSTIRFGSGSLWLSGRTVRRIKPPE